MGSDHGANSSDDQARDNFAYVRQMLAQLRQVAHNEKADLLCYLIEMAYVEAGDLQAGRRNGSGEHRERH